MTVVALAGSKAAPGVTTAALALAAVWPGRRGLLLVEADPDGGVLAARAGRWSGPRLTSLAADARRGLEAGALDHHAQRLPGGIPALLAPPDPAQAGRALARLARPLAEALAAERRDVLVDVGRLRPDSAAGPLLEAADLLAVVTRPRLDELQYLGPQLAERREAGRPVALVLVGERPYSPGEVAEAVDVPVAGVLAEDPRAARVLAGRTATGGWLGRSRLIRSARGLVEVLLTDPRQFCQDPPRPPAPAPPAPTGPA